MDEEGGCGWGVGGWSDLVSHDGGLWGWNEVLYIK